MTCDSDPARPPVAHQPVLSPPQHQGVSRGEAVFRALLAFGAAVVSMPVALFALLSMTLDLHSCDTNPEQLACGTYPSELVKTLCLVAMFVLLFGGLGFAGVSTVIGRRWWLGFAALVAVYAGLLGTAYLLVVL